LIFRVWEESREKFQPGNFDSIAGSFDQRYDSTKCWRVCNKSVDFGATGNDRNRHEPCSIATVAQDWHKPGPTAAEPKVSNWHEPCSIATVTEDWHEPGTAAAIA
jgi:hypothetical protein